MCFAIPYKILKVNKKSVLIEGGKKITTGEASNLKAGDYVRVAGNVVVDSIKKEEGLHIRKLIKSVYVQNN